MNTYLLEIELHSDAAFSSSEGLASLLDSEIQHDEYGRPFLGGRTLKGLLVEECAGILYALQRQNHPQLPKWETAATRLFGVSGMTVENGAILHVGTARLPEILAKVIEQEVDQGKITREQVLYSLTSIRRQTAIDPHLGSALAKTLRSYRVVLRGLRLQAALAFFTVPTDADLALLAACTKALRRAGTGRNRGAGELKAHLLDLSNQADQTEILFGPFRKTLEVVK